MDGHIFISVLAYPLLTWVREKLRDQGDQRDWKAGFPAQKTWAKGE